MAKKNGIRQVAAEAKVSIGTVSKILNPDSACNIQVSPETRERVMAVAQKLAYQPSYSAKLLRGEASRTIGFALSQPMDTIGAYLSDYHAAILNGVGRVAGAHGYQVLLLNGVDYRHFMDIKRVDAMVVTNYNLSDNPYQDAMREMFERFTLRQYPFAVINGDPAIPGIRVDNQTGMKLALAHLAERGYCSVGFIGEITDNPQRHLLERAAVLRREAGHYGIRFAEEACIERATVDLPSIARTGRCYHADGTTALRYLAEKKILPRALVCGHDWVAFGVIRQALALGIRIPEDLAVIGFDDVPQSAEYSPGLTSLHQPLEEFGATAMMYLLQKIADPAATLDLTVAPTLQIRQSS